MHKCHEILLVDDSEVEVRLMELALLEAEKLQNVRGSHHAGQPTMVDNTILASGNPP